MASENVATLNRQLAQKLLDEAKNNPPLRMQASSSASPTARSLQWRMIGTILLGDWIKQNPIQTRHSAWKWGETIPKST